MDAPLHGNNPAAPRGSAEDGAAHLPKNGGSGEQSSDMAKNIVPPTNGLKQVSTSSKQVAGGREKNTVVASAADITGTGSLTITFKSGREGL